MSHCNCRDCTVRRDGRPDVVAAPGSDGRIKSIAKARRYNVELTDQAGFRRIPFRSDSEERAIEYARANKPEGGRAVVLVDEAWDKPLREVQP